MNKLINQLDKDTLQKQIIIILLNASDHSHYLHYVFSNKQLIQRTMNELSLYINAIRSYMRELVVLISL